MRRILTGILIAPALFLFSLSWRSDSSQPKEGALACEEASPNTPTMNLGTQGNENTPATIQARARVSSTPNSSTANPPPSAAEDLRKIQELLDQGQITPEVYEQKHYDLVQIHTLHDQNLLGEDVYEIKRRQILGEAPITPPSNLPTASTTRPRAADRLRELKELLDQSLITPEEYQRKREEILNEL